MANVNTLDIRKKIKVKDAWLSEAGLELLYDYDGQERFETLLPLQAAELMREHGIFTDFTNDDDYLEVKWFIDYEYSETDYRPITKTASWEMFAQHYKLSQYEILEIAATLESDRAKRQMMKQAQAENAEKYAEMKK
jgi:hypothetical protein